MSATEIATALFCLVTSVSLIAIAWWVSRISASLACIRYADAVVREKQGQNILSRIVCVEQSVQELRRKHDEMLWKIQLLIDPTGEQPMIADSPASSEEPLPAPAPTGTPAPHLASALEDGLDGSARRGWTGPPSSRTMLGIVATPMNGAAPASSTARSKR